MIDLKEEREDYLVRLKSLPELVGEFVYKTLFTAINRQGVVFLWPVRLPTPDDRQNRMVAKSRARRPRWQWQVGAASRPT